MGEDLGHMVAGPEAELLEGGLEGQGPRAPESRTDHRQRQGASLPIRTGAARLTGKLLLHRRHDGKAPGPHPLRCPAPDGMMQAQP
jgi:hypothetical protein